MSKDTPDPSTTTGTAPAATPDAPTPPATPAKPATSTTPSAAARADLPNADDTVVGDVVVEAMRPSLVARLGAEALGTFLLVLVGLGVSLYSALSGAGTLGVALGFGLALIGGTITLGHISGGHFNPAVTIGAAIAGRTPWRDLLPYWLAQIVGGVLAAATLFLTIPSALPGLVAQGAAGASTKTFFAATANGFGAHSPLSTLSKGQVTFDLLPAMLIEIVATALLVGVVLAATNRRAQHTLAPFAMGLTYAVLMLVASPVTNGGLNPARSTAAAVFSGGAVFGQLWLFWVAPVIGATLAGLAYRTFAAEPVQDNLLEHDDLLVGEEEILLDERA